MIYLIQDQYEQCQLVDSIIANSKLIDGHSDFNEANISVVE